MKATRNKTFEIMLVRHKIGHATIGQLFVEGKLFCHTLEPKNVNWNKDVITPGRANIPAGTYNVSNLKVTDWKKKYETMPVLQNVPNFRRVLIKPGNNTDDTMGDILVGWHMYQRIWAVFDSQETFDLLNNWIREKSGEGQVFLNVCRLKGSIDTTSFSVHPLVTHLYARYEKYAKIDKKYNEE